MTATPMQIVHTPSMGTNAYIEITDTTAFNMGQNSFSSAIGLKRIASS